MLILGDLPPRGTPTPLNEDLADWSLADLKDAVAEIYTHHHQTNQDPYYRDKVNAFCNDLSNRNRTYPNFSNSLKNAWDIGGVTAVNDAVFRGLICTLCEVNRRDVIENFVYFMPPGTRVELERSDSMEEMRDVYVTDSRNRRQHWRCITAQDMP